MAYPHSQQLYADPLTAPTPSSGAYHDRPSHSPQPGYIYDQSGRVIQDHGYASAPLGRHRSTSDSSLAPIVPTIVMGHEAEHGGAAPTGERLERRKSLAASVRSWRGRGHQDDLPPGWTKEDEEAERLFLAQGMFDWQSMKSWRFWIRKEWWYWYVAAIILAVLVALMALFHDDIVHWLEPVANWMKNLPAGYTIPAAIIFILSFPPLFGQEIVAVICGLVWGLWVGFAIVAAGTFLGEVGNFYAFKYLCRGRAEKYERDNLNYAIMAHVVRDGGFFFIFAVRMSAIPGHFSTAVFATCGMGIFIFSLACILTMPKQLIVVYLGVLFKQQEKSQKSKIISWTVLVVGGLITIWAMWYSYKKMNSVKLIVWRRQRVALAAKGVSVDPVTGARRRSTVDRLDVIPDKDEAEVLMKQTERPGSYQTPYYIRYQSTDNMSVYHVDPTKQPAGGQDITDMSHQPDHDSQAFPEARPSYPPQSSNSNLRRNQTTVSRYSTHLEPHHHAEFPVPIPSGTSAAGFAIDPTSPNPILNGQAYNMAGEGPYGPGGPYHAGYGGGYDGGYAEEGRGSLMPPAYGHIDHPSHGAHGGAGGYPGGGGYPESLSPAQAR